MKSRVRTYYDISVLELFISSLYFSKQVEKYEESHPAHFSLSKREGVRKQHDFILRGNGAPVLAVLSIETNWLQTPLKEKNTVRAEARVNRGNILLVFFHRWPINFCALTIFVLSFFEKKKLK